jgi:hypothetical protein
MEQSPKPPAHLRDTLARMILTAVAALVLLLALLSSLRIAREYQRAVVFDWDAIPDCAAPACSG